MRIWHKALVSEDVLPQKQLQGQWRELCAIAKNIVDKGTPNHLLVNKVLDYPTTHFITYSNIIVMAMKNKGVTIKDKTYAEFVKNIDKGAKYFAPSSVDYLITSLDDLYKDWHNERYLRQCFYNLEEKHDNDGISDKEWHNIKQLCARYNIC